MIEKLRSLLRATGLASRVSPLFSWFEARKLAQFGPLKRRRDSDQTATIISATKESFHIGPPAHFAHMAVSPHETPTLVSFLNVFAPVIKAGVAWDVGGNAGFYSALLAKIVGPQGRVFVFEPVPATFQSMCANLKVADVENVTPMNLALSDKDGVLPISFDPANDTTSSLEKASGASCVDVRVATGDHLVESAECLPPTMIKIDIEGHELKALAGMRRILSRPECRAVLCEIHFSILAASGEGHAAAKARALFRDAGFDRITFISRSHLMATKGSF